MQIIDDHNLIDNYRKLALEKNNVEHCAVAIGRKLPGQLSCYEIEDYCSICELGGRTTQNSVIIPWKISYALIKVCIKNKNIPIIMHTHTSQSEEISFVSFSDIDQKFINSFYSSAKDCGFFSTCLFLVTDGNSVMACEKNQFNENYVLL